MRETQLHELLRRALASSLAAPLVLAAACGGTVASPGTQVDDAGIGDSSHRTAEAGCEPNACRVACTQGTTLNVVCTGSFQQCTCVPDTVLDAGAPDVSQPDAADPCHPTSVGCTGTTIPASCFDGGIPGDAGTAFTYQQCQALCGAAANAMDCEVTTDDGGAGLNCFTPCLGRRPPGMCTTRSRGSLLGRHFADAAQLEAAAVDAFDVLRRELEAHGAPDDLLRATRAARADEVRHARMTARLARRYGGRAVKPRAHHAAVRSLEALAIENAVEGCVRETVGALLAMHQATAAEDPRVRALMASIAPDETRHAALGWAVAAWAEAKLSREARARVQDAQRSAVATLRTELAREVPAEVVAVAGLPTPAAALRMLDALTASLWGTDRLGSDATC